jgi:hypothetical protein
MKKIIMLLIILVSAPSLNYAQFNVLEKVEVYLSYGQGVQNKIENVFLANNEKQLFYRAGVDLKNSRCTLYDVQPGEYLLGFDSGEELVLAYHVYSIKYDPVSFLIYSEIYYENKVEVRENRNLKIYLYVANEEDSGMGLVKKKEFRHKDYDSLYFDYFIPGNYALDAQETKAALKDKISSTNESETQEDIRKVQMTTGCESRFQYAKQMTEFYKDYSPLFNAPGCSYCLWFGI